MACVSLHHKAFGVGILLVAISTWSPTAEKIAGPFRIIPYQMESCPDALLDLPFRLVAKTVRDRHDVNLWHFSINYTTNVAFNDELNTEVRFASWSARGGWKDNAVVMKSKKACWTCKNYLPVLWTRVQEKLGRKCPYPPGDWYIDDLQLDLQPTGVPAFFYGKWRVNVLEKKPTTGTKELTVLCVRVYVQVVPK